MFSSDMYSQQVRSSTTSMSSVRVVILAGREFRSPDARSIIILHLNMSLDSCLEIDNFIHSEIDESIRDSVSRVFLLIVLSSTSTSSTPKIMSFTPFISANYSSIPM